MAPSANTAWGNVTPLFTVVCTETFLALSLMVVIVSQQLTAGTDWASEDLYVATWTIDKADWVVLCSSITQYSCKQNEDQRSFHLAKE